MRNDALKMVVEEAYRHPPRETIGNRIHHNPNRDRQGGVIEFRVVEASG